MSEHYSGAELKQKNRNNIYRMIHNEGCVSKQLITSRLGLSLPTVTQNLVELSERELIKEQGSFGNTGGRRAKGYVIVPGRKMAVGVDVNHQHYSVVLLDLAGTVLARKREYRLFENSDDYYKLLGGAVDAIIAEAGVAEADILGVGVAVQGIVTADRSAVSYGVVLDITGETLSNIGRYIRYPKALFHDSDMAAFAERWTRPELTDAVYISLSTNLGGAVIGVSGKAHVDDYGLARIEHMTLVPGGKRCYCGQSGCADAYCASSVLTAATADGRLETFFRRLKEGDGELAPVWDEYMSYLAIVINNVRMLFDSNVILGGYLAEYLDDYLEELKRRAYARNSFDKKCDYISLSRIRSEPVSTGAALQFVEDFIDSI